jgi:hypothetical protein
MRVLDSGVLMWKVTLSKSETIWSMAVGTALWRNTGQSFVFVGGGNSEAYSGAKRSLRRDSMRTFW